jgi:hypothetical protein
LKKSVKAALLSILVFPGMGHLYLKKYILALSLSIGAATATYFIVSSAVQTALEVLEKIQGGNIPLEVSTITELVSQQSRIGEYSTDIPMIALFTFWVIGILDSFRVGCMLEKVDAVAGENET